MAEEPGLFGDDESTPSPFSAAMEAAELALGGRARGRPPGARNPKSVDFEKWYYAAGFKDPAHFLAEIVSADPMVLARVAAIGTAEALEMQRRAAGDLMPYLHGKKPTEVVVTDERLPTLIVVTNSNQLEEARQLLDARQALALGVPLTIDQTPAIPGVSEEGE